MVMMGGVGSKDRQVRQRCAVGRNDAELQLRFEKQNDCLQTPLMS
jgi:hypothetical protein